MGELREFVYLDDISINSNLSSLGKGVPAEITQSTEDESEKSGKAGGTIWGIGAEGKYGSIDKSAVETTLEITEPYRFQSLIDVLSERGIEIRENPNPEELERGEVVRIEGTAKPMSLFKFEMAINTFTDILDIQTAQTISNVEQADMQGVEESELEEIEMIGNVIQKFMGNKIPLRIETEDQMYGVGLERDNMRINPHRAFFEPQRYTLIGRVDNIILSNSSWDPALATNIMDRYMGDESGSDEIRIALEEAAEDMDMPMDEEDWELSGETAVIHPISVFW